MWNLLWELLSVLITRMNSAFLRSMESLWKCLCMPFLYDVPWSLILFEFRLWTMTSSICALYNGHGMFYGVGIVRDSVSQIGPVWASNWLDQCNTQPKSLYSTDWLFNEIPKRLGWSGSINCKVLRSLHKNPAFFKCNTGMVFISVSKSRS